MEPHRYRNAQYPPTTSNQHTYNQQHQQHQQHSQQLQQQQYSRRHSHDQHQDPSHQHQQQQYSSYNQSYQETPAHRQHPHLAPLQPGFQPGQGPYTQHNVMSNGYSSPVGYAHQGASPSLGMPPSHSFPNQMSRPLPPAVPAPQPHPYHFRDQPHMPPSPSHSNLDEDEDSVRTNFADPESELREFDGKKYALIMRQEPTRARMCGFGDKDRRPISSPPIVQVIICDHDGKEIDYKNTDIELTHLICQAHCYDGNGQLERSITKSTSNQQIISTASMAAYPISVAEQAEDRRATRLPSGDSMYMQASNYAQRAITDPAYHATTSVHHSRDPSNSFSTNYSQSSQTGEAHYVSNGSRPQFGSATGYQPAVSPYGQPSSYPTPRNSSHTRQSTSVGPSQPPTPPLTRDSGETPGFSRNLIGTHVTSAQLLQDCEDNWGVFFIFSDLSIRSEGWFRLKLSLFSVGQVTTHMSQQEVFDIASANNTAPSAGSSTEANRSGKSRIEGLKAGLIAKTAPNLATGWTRPFKVFSAKKFPGVEQSTALSQKFADQGVKISIRKIEKDGKDGKKRNADDAELDDDSD